MPIDRKRYPANWEQIAKDVKDAACFSVSVAGRCVCALEKNLTLSPVPSGQWQPSRCIMRSFTPEDNAKSNLLALCTPCHLALHAQAKRKNVSRLAVVIVVGFG